MSRIYKDAAPLREERKFVRLDDPNHDGVFVSPEDLQDEYELQEDFEGLFVLFNHDTFPSENLFRQGSVKDQFDLVDCLNRLRYQVRQNLLKYNYMKWEVEVALKNIAEMDHSKHHSLIIVFLTHGDDGGKLLCSDGQYITCQDVWSFFTADKCPGLIGKPKIFIFQACKGDEISKPSHAVESDKIKRAEMAQKVYAEPAEADILVAYGTFEGNMSFRCSLMGSWFIQELCKNFTAHGRRDDIVTLFTRITKCVAHHYQTAYLEKKEESRELVLCKQMPFFISTLTRKFYLCKSKERGFILDMCRSIQLLREENKTMLDILQKLEAKVDALAPKKEGEDSKEKKKRGG